MNEGWIAALAALGGGAFVKILEVFFIPRASKEDFAAKLREELRTDIRTLRDEIGRLQKDLDAWKLKYFELLQKYSKLSSKYDELLLKYEDMNLEMHNISK